MSTGCECEFFEARPGAWYYLLERLSAPKGAYDWREHADCYGPFSSEEAADAHLSANHANPGGSHTTHNESFELDAVYEKLIAEAHTPGRRRYR